MENKDKDGVVRVVNKDSIMYLDKFYDIPNKDVPVLN